MLISNHPDDARLSALASQDADAVADAALTSHVEACDRCSTALEELGALRAHLAALPDVAPHRPLRLLPDAAAAPDRLGVWVRKVFGPVMAAGAALALVGMVGTVAPNLSSQAGSAPAADSGVWTPRRSSAASVADCAAGGVENHYSVGVPERAARQWQRRRGSGSRRRCGRGRRAFGSTPSARRGRWSSSPGIAVLIAGGDAALDPRPARRLTRPTAPGARR